MALDRTWFNALVDDAGDGMSGSVWDKADIKNLLDSVDAELARIDAATARPCCILYNTADQPWGSGVWANVPWTGEWFDPFGMHAPGDYVISAPSPGIYLASASVIWPANPNGNRNMQFLANGSFQFPLVNYQKAPATGGMTTFHTGLVQLVSAGSYVTLQLYQDSGAQLLIPALGMRFEVYKITS